jgi:leucyl-tRNA synthetase
MADYDFQDIETRWQQRWADTGAFEVDEDPSRPKYYCLEMLPYPSGDIHVGHVRNYCITDVISRSKTMRGFNVMHPIGWDALGLPAENAAIQRGVHPEKWTRQNIAGMKRQLQRLGFSYPWSREIATCDPEYYHWNQWFFLRMLEKGIAYRANSPVNWCPSCQTVLANEQAEGGICWRCKNEVEQRDMVLVQQENWVGKSPGAEADFPVEGLDPIRVFTTRVDTIYGATFMVLAPEHPMVDALLEGAPDAADRKKQIARLRAQDRRARLEGQVEKEGVFTGRHATNPYNGERIPIWVGNFVLMGYGTGAIMSVPAHDQRDLEFARKYDLNVRVVIQPEGPDPDLDGATLEEAYSGEGRVVNSGPFDGLPSAEAIPKMAAHAEEKGFGKATITYRLKDWLISRQRYWGTPIPVVYCEKDGVVPVPDDQLPVVLPPDAPFTGEGGNPLEKVPGFVNATCPSCGGEARRETDTMDTFVDSSWYFYRYLSPGKDDGPVDADAVKYWFPIDLYVGGIEHAILHLVYARFWTKMMRDLGVVGLDEPVVRLFPQGMVHRDGEVMSKSKGNTIAPDDVVGRYGADTLRLYILFAAPPELPMEWSESGIEGPHRFLLRVWRLVDRHGAGFAGKSAAPLPAELPDASGRAARGRELSAAQGAPDHRQGDPRHRGPDPAEHRGGGPDGARERDLPPRGRGGEGPGRPRLARGPRDGHPAVEPVHASHLRGDVDAPRARRRPGAGPLAGLRRRSGPRGRGRARGPGERKGPWESHGGARGGRGDGTGQGARGRGPAGGGEASGQGARRPGASGERGGEMTRATAGIAVVALIASGCGYALEGRGITTDPSVKRIGVPRFKDNTGRVDLDARVTEAVVAELTKRGRFTVVKEATGVDAVIVGEILSYDNVPINFTGGEGTVTEATRYAITLTASVVYRKVGEAEPIWENDAFSVRDEYDLDDTAEGFFDREDQSIMRLSEEFSQRLVAAMLEAF